MEYTEEKLNELKPVCKTCGLAMKQIEFRGYYDEFLFWDFSCNCNDKIPFKIDDTERGAYA